MARQRQHAHTLLNDFADHKEFALERLQPTVTKTDEHLAYRWLDRLHALAKARVVRRHIAPAEQLLAFFAHDGGDNFFTSRTCRGSARQEQHTDGIVPGLRQLNVLFAELAAQKTVRYLNQDTCTIARQFVGTGGATVTEVIQYLQALFDNDMAALAADVGNKTNAAGVVLLLGGV